MPYDPHHQDDDHQLPSLPGVTQLDPVETKSHATGPTHLQGDETDPDAAVAFRHGCWQSDRGRVAAALRRVSDSDSRLARFDGCGRYAWACVDRSDPDRWCISANLCHDRFCKPCATARARQISGALADRARGRRVLFITLTLKSVFRPLHGQVDRLYRCFAHLRRLALWKASIVGGAAILEVTYNHARGQWHPHLHILAEGSYLPVSELRSLWLKITGNSHVVDVRLAQTTDHLAAYIAKYLGKAVPSNIIRSPLELDEFILAMKGRRAALTFGTWRGTPLTLDTDVTDWLPKFPLVEVIEDARNGLPYATRILALLRGEPQCNGP